MLGTLEIIRGNSYNEPLAFTDENGPLNLTDYKVYITVKKVEDLKNNNDDDAVIQKVYENIPNPVDWILYPNITPEDTKIKPIWYAYDIKMISPSGVEDSVEKWLLIIKQGVTSSS